MERSALHSSSSSDNFGGDILGEEIPQDSPKPKRPRRPFYRRPAFIIIVIVVVILAALLLGVRAIRQHRMTHYTTTAVTRGSLQLTVSASGNVDAPEYDVSPTSQGETITALDVAIGQQVESGDTLATLSHTDTHGNSQTETLAAPNAGTVVAINGVVNGKPTQPAFIVIDDLTATYLTLNVSESDIASVAQGQAVTFTATAYANLATPFKGTIMHVSAGGQNNNNVIIYPVTVTIDRASLQGVTLFPQMTVDASVVTTHRDQVLLIAANAPSFAHSEADAQVISSTEVDTALSQARALLTQVQQSDRQATNDDLTASYVLEWDGNRLVVVPVVLGLSDGTTTEVLAGLTEGTAVVTG